MADIVGGIASVTQLAAYSQCVMGTLSRLYRAAQDGPASAKDHCQGISRLLKIVDRIGHRDGSDSELFVPLLVDIAQVAKTLTGYLDQRKQCHTIWVLLTNGGAIDDAFGALREKTSHLHLCLSQQNNKALGEIQQELVARRSIMSSNSSPDPPQVSSILTQAVYAMPLTSTQVPPKDNTFVSSQVFCVEPRDAPVVAHTCRVQIPQKPDRQRTAMQRSPRSTDQAVICLRQQVTETPFGETKGRYYPDA